MIRINIAQNNYTGPKEEILGFFRKFNVSAMFYIAGLVQDCSNSIANALELMRSCWSI